MCSKWSELGSPVSASVRHGRDLPASVWSCVAERLCPEPAPPDPRVGKEGELCELP